MSPTVDGLRDRYLDLLKRSVCGLTLADPPLALYAPAGNSLATKAGAFLNKALRTRHLALARTANFDEARREQGHDHPASALSMIGLKRLTNLQECVETVIADGVPGDLIETGVWRGGACILMRGILEAHGVHDRTVWVADSFQGLPPPDADSHPADAGDKHHLFDSLAVSQQEVAENFARFGLLDEQVRFLEGWFSETLPTAPIEQLAVARLDGDMYGSTIDALTALYPKLSAGGFLIIDDYNLGPCKQAVTDYRQAHGITEPIVDIDGRGVFWRRG